MRIWHTALIPVLPKAHLVAQWRELSAIAGAIEKNGTPNHVLVNFVLDYDYDHFISYAYYVRKEMTKRGIRTMQSVWEKIVNLKPNFTLLPIVDVYSKKMDNLYLKICYYNLYEKYMCGMFSEEEYEPIDEIVRTIMHIN